MSSNGKAFVLGYTGGTGKALVKQLAQDNYFSNIVLIGRRQVYLRDFEIVDDTRFTQRVIDFDNIKDFTDDFKGFDVGFCCLGTVRAKVGKEMFVKVDRDYVVSSAEVAKSAGCRHFQLVSSYGANKNSSFLYTKIKGEVEEILKEVSFHRLSIYQPGFLVGKRQECRPGEICIKCMGFPCIKLFPTAATIEFRVLAKAMVNNAKRQTAEAVETFSNKDIHRLAKAAIENEAYSPIERV